VPKWWTAQIFLGVLYALVESKKIYIFKFKCPLLYDAEIVTINDIAIKYFKFHSESSLCANSLVTVGLCLVNGGTRKVRKLIKYNVNKYRTKLQYNRYHVPAILYVYQYFIHISL